MFNIQELIDEAKCYEEVRKLRWPTGVRCARCGSGTIRKRGFHNRHTHRQRYRCGECQAQFDDLTGSIFEGHHQPLRVWMIGLYLMGLNLSNQQIAKELGLNRSDVQEMTSQLRSGVVEKKSQSS